MPLYRGVDLYTQTVPANALTRAVARELQDLRKSQGLSQSQLAELSGIPRVSIQRYESGGSIRVEDLGTLAWALGRNPGELLAAAADRVQRED